MTRRVPAIAAAPGRASGPVWTFEPSRGSHPDGSGEISVQDAAARAAATLDVLGAHLRAAGRVDEAAILDAQALIATDPALLGAARDLADAGAPQADAVRDAAAGIAGRIAASANPRTAARSSDILDVGDRIARVLDGAAFDGPARPSVVVGRDLPPSAVVEIPAGMILAIALEEGSPTAHVAILARALGIPVVVAASGLLGAVAALGEDGAFAEVDGTEGWIAVGSGAEVGSGRVRATRARPVDAGERAAVRVTGARTGRPDPARSAAAAPSHRGGGTCATADGARIGLYANIGRPQDAAAALAAGAEGIGLFRTESLFLGRASAPSEESQRAAYRRVLATMGDRPVVLRLADLGGDRPVPYLSGQAEVNPGLGVRGIRLARRDRWLHAAQLRAIAQAAADRDVTARVLAPMVATLDDADLFREMCEEAWSAVAAEAAGSAAATMPSSHVPRPPLLGAMVEVPAAALVADQLARRVDYLSVGTNDLTQYALAADRGVAALARLQDALDPAILRLVRMTVEAGAAAGIPVGACGELAGDPEGALVLVGLGVDSLSTEPMSFGRIRAALAAARMSDLRSLAESALRAPSATAVRGLASEVRRAR